MTNFKKDFFIDCVTRFTVQNIPELHDELYDFICSNDENVDNKTTKFGRRHPEAIGAAVEFRKVFSRYEDEINTLLENDNEARQRLIHKIYDDVSAAFKSFVENYNQRPYVDLINALSGEMYESGEMSGKSLVLFSGDDIADGLKFDKTARIELKQSNIHAIRKQLNMCNKNMALALSKISGSFWTMGLIPFQENYESIEFLGHMNWNLCNSNRKCILSCVNGTLMLPKVSLEEEFRDIAKSIFDDEKITKIICEVVNSTTKHHGGAVIIFAPEEIIKSETERLAIKNNRGIAFEVPFDICRDKEKIFEFTSMLASIDGAIFIDTNGYCHACGIILDGRAVEGSSARGARFNSTKSYIASLKEKCLGVVLSEDVMLDCFV